MTLVERIKMLADEKKTTFAEIERKTGISNGQIRRWDKSSPKIENIQKVADYLDVSTDFLLGRVDWKKIDDNLTNKHFESVQAHSSNDLKSMVEKAMSFDGKPMNDNDKEAILAYLEGRFSSK
jgi:transcriptional regulator with XRE-family HTH domain